MTYKNNIIHFFVLILISKNLSASQTITEYIRPNKITERCIQVEPLLTAQYSVKDLEKEQELCKIDLYNDQIKLCPKNWSTSPTTLLLGPGSANSGFSLQICDSKKSMDSYKKLAKYKMSMNETGTSATFSPSPVLYYHLSRFLKSSIKVPVAVFRTMDKSAHFNLVTSRVKNLENVMVQTAWNFMSKAESVNPNAVGVPDELFNADRTQVFGALVDSIGDEKYGENIRGLKQPQWGLPQHTNLLKTPAFIALSRSENFLDASDQALNLSQNQFTKDMGLNKPSSHQMMMWMQDLSDMTILDYIMQQQDRPNNIHFQWKIYYIKNNQLESDRIYITDAQNQKISAENIYPNTKDQETVEQIALKQYANQCKLSPCFVMQKSWIEDNDAGGRTNYLKFFRQAGILESIKHLNPLTYQQLMVLAQSIRTKNTIYSQLQNNFKIDSQQFDQLCKNIVEAAQVLRNQCKAGVLKFDLDTAKFMLTGSSSALNIPCQ